MIVRLQWLGLAMGLLACVAAPSPALENRDLVLEFQGDAPEALTGSLRLESSEQVAALPFRWSPGDGPVQLSVSPTEPSVLLLESDRFWAPPTEVGMSSKVVMPIFPKAAVRGFLEGTSTRDAEQSYSVSGRLGTTRADSAGGIHALEDVPLSCRVQIDSAFSCPIPAGIELDLRIEVPGFVPTYFWGIRASEDAPTDLGSVPLRSGGSIVGFVVASKLDAPIRVRAEPQLFGWLGDPAERNRLKRRTVEVTANESGFFQIGPLDHGQYKLVASREMDDATAGREQVVVDGQRETEIGDPLRLVPPFDVEFLLDPPLGPGDEPWNVTVLAPRKTSARLETKASGLASLGGFFRAESLRPRRYEVLIHAANGDRWHRAEVDLDAESGLQVLTVPQVEIEGEVTRGEEPWPAVLIFGGASGQLSIRMETDEDGRFAGALPREGTWPVELGRGEHYVAAALEPIKIEASSDGGPTWVEIDLADTVLRGRVVDEDGVAIDDAVVDAIRMDQNRRDAEIPVESNGSFEIAGLEPGPIRVRARSGRRSSAWQTLRLEEGRELPDAELVVRDSIRVEGRVASVGRPLAGVQLFAHLEATDAAEIRQVTTDVAGRFSVDVPATTTRIHALVDAPGMAVELVAWPVGGSTPVEIEVARSGGSVTFIGDLRRLMGTSLSRQAAHLQLLSLYGYLRSSGRVQAGQDGFTVFHLSPGIYRWCAAPEPCRDVAVAPGSTSILELPDEADQPRPVRETI